jgi:hypothetical protein
VKPVLTRPTGRYAAIGGTGVIIATAGIAIVEFSAMRGFAMEPIDWILLIFVSVLVIGGGLAMSRFVCKHGAEIGEARFDTSHADQTPAKD